MENNLDDILVDPLEEKQKKPKSKRWILISVALVLLVSVVAIVLYFIFAKKEENKGLEAVHTELERFETFVQKQSMESQKDDEFDKLIAEIKAKHQDASPQSQSNESTKTNETPKAQAMDQKKDLVKALQETQGMKPQEQKTHQQKPQDQSIKQPLAQSSKEEKAVQKKPKVEAKKIEEKEEKPISSNLSVSNAFDSLEIPKGFYLQVGVFSNTPNPDFLSQLSTLPYRVEKFNKQGKIVNRYLVGPFKTRIEAEAKILEVTQKITKPVVVEIP